MELHAKLIRIICQWLSLVLLCCFSEGKPLIIEGDIKMEETNVRTMSYTIRTNTWSSGLIPVHIDTSINQNSATLTKVKTAMFNVQTKTDNCIRFVQRDSSISDYINITGSDSGCYSSVGKVGGEQVINIGPGCDQVRIVMHELLHALGFWHEQSRNDRDNYVDIIFKNIITGRESEFDKRPDSTGVEAVIPYDFFSLLHYKHNQFAKISTLDTIIPNAKYSYIDKTELGDREHLSEKDVARMKWLYRCDTAGTKLVTVCQPPTFVNIKVIPEQFKYTVGNKVAFSCRVGVLIGANESTCANGAWSGAKPFCVTADARSFHYCDMGDCLTRIPGKPSWFMPRFYNQVATWKQYSGPTSTTGTGPDADHTMQDSAGSYLLMEATGVPAGQSALAVSPLIKIQTTVCLTFFYYMYGDDIDSTTKLSVFINAKPSWSNTGPTQKNEWTKVVINDIVLTGDYAYVFIMATRSRKGDKSDIAIDDVFFGPCKEVKAYANL